MLSMVHVLGDYWCDGTDERSALGELIAAVKDEGAAATDHRALDALDELCTRMSRFAEALDLSGVATVVAVPPAPDRRAHPVTALAEAVGAGIGVGVAGLVTRRLPTARLRDTPPEQRSAVVEAASYQVRGDVDGMRILLVDDVILTGTTLNFIAGLLVAAGAEQVDAVVAARTRRGRG
jgi:predicted amidophosphoribosyltransferase